MHVTFVRGALTDDDLFATDLDVAYLYRYLVRTVAGVPCEVFLSADATELHRRALRECCAYLVQVTGTLPRFQSDAPVEVLRREKEILEAVRNVLEALPERRHADDFAADLRRQVVTVLDRIELFAAGLTGRDPTVPAASGVPEPEREHRPRGRVRQPDRTCFAAHAPDPVVRRRRLRQDDPAAMAGRAMCESTAVGP